MAAIPKEKPPEGFTYLKWEELRQQVQAFREGFSLWREMAPSRRLDWILRFIRKNLDTLSARERLTDSYVLRSMTGKSGIPVTKKGAAVVSATGETALVAMEISDLKKIQRKIAEGVRGLAGTEGFSWDIPGPKVIRVSRFNAPMKIGRGDTEVPQKLLLQGMWEWGDNPIAPLLYEVAGLLWTCGKNLRLCKECDQPFIGKKRGLYCSVTCGQTVWDANKAKKEAKAKEQATRPAKRRATS